MRDTKTYTQLVVRHTLLMFNYRDNQRIILSIFTVLNVYDIVYHPEHPHTATRCSYVLCNILPDDGPVISEPCRSLTSLKYCCESNDICVHLLVYITEV